MDLELLRLEKIERSAREQFQRLSRPGAFSEHADVVKAAEDLWLKAAAAVVARQEK